MMPQKADKMQKKVLKNKDIARNLGLEEKVKKSPAASAVGLLSDRDSGVLNRKVMDARREAGSIIEDARLEAEKIRAEALNLLAQVEDERAKEKKRGFEDGREEGLAGVTESLVKFEKMREEFYRDAEENIIKLVMMIVEKVIGKIVHENGGAIKAIVKQALESAIGDRILVRLSPGDCKTVTSSESEFRGMLDRTRRITFREDDTITSGGCMVETEVGTIDARLETQLKAIKKALEL